MFGSGIVVVLALVSLCGHGGQAKYAGTYEIPPMVINLGGIEDDCDPDSSTNDCADPKVCALTLSGAKCVTPDLIYCTADADCSAADVNIWGCYLGTDPSTNPPGLRGICNGCTDDTTCAGNTDKKTCWKAVGGSTTTSSVGLCVQCLVDADCTGTDEFCETSLRSSSSDLLTKFHVCTAQKASGERCTRSAECLSNNCTRPSRGFWWRRRRSQLQCA